VFAGLPDDSQSSFRRGAARGPQRIRRAYTAACYNSTSESGVDLARSVSDVGDVAPQGSWQATAAAFRAFVESALREGKTPFLAGGDHAVSVPAIEALRVLGRPVHVIQIDAHPDLYPEYESSRTSHACVAARLLEMEHVASVTQYGIRTMNAAQRVVAEAHKARLRIFNARELTSELPAPRHLPRRAPVWFDIDLDGFDPAFAPGVSHPVPGGLTPRQALNLIQSRPWNLVGMSVVELNPDSDVNDQTAILAARLLHEGMAAAALKKGNWKLENGN
jgi:agmatinase